MQRGFRYAYSLTHNRMDAEELVQEACYAISRLGGPWNVPYLFRSIRNRYIDAGRRRNLLQVEPFSEAIHSEMPDDDLVLMDFDDRMDEALGQLSDGERELLFLSVVEGYTARELSELTDSPRGTVLSRLHRIKGRLRHILESSEPGKREAASNG